MTVDTDGALVQMRRRKTAPRSKEDRYLVALKLLVEHGVAAAGERELTPVK